MSELNERIQDLLDRVPAEQRQAVAAVRR